MLETCCRGGMSINFTIIKKKPQKATFQQKKSRSNQEWNWVRLAHKPACITLSYFGLDDVW